MSDTNTKVQITDMSFDEALGAYAVYVKNLETPIEVTNAAINDTNMRVLHAAIGISSEAGELIDHMKKIFYADRPIDPTNIKEEVGDILWYIQLMCNILGFSIKDAMQTNIDKLWLRHGAKLNLKVSGDYSARDLTAERQVLEASMSTLDNDEVLFPGSKGPGSVRTYVRKD